MNEPLDLHIYAITGELLYSQKVTNAQEMNIEKLQSGLYICQILQNGAMIHQQKLVIQQ
jgi:hypothetical protein